MKMDNQTLYTKLAGMPRSDVPEGYSDFAGLYELAGKQYLLKSLVGNLEGMFLAANVRKLLGVSSLKTDLGIQVQQLAKAHVQIDGDAVTISQPYGRELYAYISIGLNPSEAEESERKGFADMHKIADFFRKYFPNKRVIEKEPQWIPTRHLEKML